MALIDITSKEEFEKLAMDKENNKLVLVDFWAEWCGPCRMVGPLLHEIAESEKYKDSLDILKVDVDAVPEPADTFQVRGIPTMLFIKNGEVVETQVGALPKAKIEEIIDKHM